MTKIEEYLEIIHRADFQEIEISRERVTFSDLGALAATYSSLESWEQKAALINLVQDHLDPRFRPMMLDFLRAPDHWEDDTISLTKAIALCHLDENLDDFLRYYNDRRLLQARVHDYVRDAPSAKEPPPPAQPQITSQKSTFQDSPWKILAVTALIIGMAISAIALINLFTLQKYRQDGIIVQARVTDKWQQDGETCIGVSYFDKDLLDGGDLYLTEICEFISDETWSAVRKNGSLEVVFLPKDPQNNTLPAAALESNQLPVFSIGGVLVVLGLLVLGWQRSKNR